jgi:hypothetical protein
MSLTTLSILIWIVLEVAILYYQVWHLRQTRRARSVIDAGVHSVVYRLAAEKLRGQYLRMSVTVLFLLLGLASFFPHLPEYTPFLILALLYGQGIGLRNERADVRLVREIAREQEDEATPPD